MKYKGLTLCALLPVAFGISGILAQENLNASGGTASGSEGSVSYSVGQLVYTTAGGLNGSVAQGLQQAYEITEVSGLKESRALNLRISVYPNPTSGEVILVVDDYKTPGLSCELYDLNGRLLKNMKISSSQTKIDMSGLDPSAYFLKVSRKNKEISTCKIVKK